MVYDKGGVVTSTDFFKYLGGGVGSALITDSRDADKRIGSAAGDVRGVREAFGALRKAIFSSRHIELRTKKAVYLAIVVKLPASRWYKRWYVGAHGCGRGRPCQLGRACRTRTPWELRWVVELALMPFYAVLSRCK